MRKIYGLLDAKLIPADSGFILEISEGDLEEIIKQLSLIEIIDLDENTPNYMGYSQLVRFGNKYFRTRDFEGYSSSLEELTEQEFKRLLQYWDKYKKK